MEVAAQRRLAAKIMKCGESRVWMDPAKLGEISQAITTADIRRLIGSDVIAALPKTGVSKGRKRYIAAQKKKGRRKGKGSRKGKIGTRFSRKRSWISIVRAQRTMLKELLAAGKVDKRLYKDLYRKSGGGYFRSRAHVQMHIDELAKGAAAKAETKEKVGKKRAKGQQVTE